MRFAAWHYAFPSVTGPLRNPLFSARMVGAEGFKSCKRLAGSLPEWPLVIPGLAKSPGSSVWADYYRFPGAIAR